MSGRTRLVALATAVALACLPASAQEARALYSGNDLWSRCSGKGDLNIGLCGGFVVGITDAMMGSGGGISGRRACIPLSVLVEQITDVVKRYLEQHPEQRHYSAASLVAQALSETFPCKP